MLLSDLVLLFSILIIKAACERPSPVYKDSSTWLSNLPEKDNGHDLVVDKQLVISRDELQNEVDDVGDRLDAGNAVQLDDGDTDRLDTSQLGQQTAPVSHGNLYYYYYPVAAYPIDEKVDQKRPHKVSTAQSQSETSSLSRFIIPGVLAIIIIIVPLALLTFYGISSTSGRSSQLDAEFGSFADLQKLIDSQLKKYLSALDADECMERIVCELGVRSSNLTGKELVIRVMKWIAPDQGKLRTDLMQIMEDAANGSYTMESCKLYKCNPPTDLTPSTTTTTENPKF